MKIFKKIILAVLCALLLVFAGIMVLPVDSFIAQRAAELRGYKITDAFDDTDYRYYYNALDGNEKLAYNIIYVSLLDFPKEIIVPDLDDDQLADVFEALSYDNPNFFFMGNKCSLTSVGNINYFLPQYLMTQAEYQKRIAEVDTKSVEILSGISADASDYDKELYIHDYLVKNNSYIESGSDMIYTVYGALVEGNINCEGYSRSAQYLLKKAGVVSHLATGNAVDKDGNTEGHMWNVVLVDGEYFNMDITWDDYTINDGVNSPDSSASHIYFNVPYEFLTGTHTIDDQNVWKECTTNTQNYFIKNELMFDSCNQEMVSRVQKAVARSLQRGNASLEIAFSNSEACSNAIDYLVGSGKMYTILRTANAVAPSNNKVNTHKVQYTKDDDKKVIRFFFTLAS